MKTKTVWTGNCDDALNAPVEEWSRKADEFFKAWAKFFGEDYEEGVRIRETRKIDKFVLAIIEGVYPMNFLDNFDYLEGLKRLAQAGKIKKTKRGWRVKK